MRTDKVVYHLLTKLPEIDNQLSGAFPFVIPQSVSIASGNFATYSIINTDAITTKTSWNDYDRVMVQISLFSSDLDSIQNLAEIIRRNIERYKGELKIDDCDYGIDIIQFENQEFVGFDEANGVYMIAQDWLFSLYRVLPNKMVDTDELNRMDTNEVGEVVY